jgi:hypothetical protein
LGWLTNTSGSFENLIVTRHWKMAYLPVSPWHNDVQESLGFTSDECGTGLSVWLRALFDQVPTLDTFSLVSTYTGTETDESSLPMRRTTFTRLDFMSARVPKGVDETYIDVEHLSRPSHVPHRIRIGILQLPPHCSTAASRIGLQPCQLDVALRLMTCILSAGTNARYASQPKKLGTPILMPRDLE